jgi:hypothetical protein
MPYNLDRLLSEISRIHALRGFLLMKDLFSAATPPPGRAVLRFDVERSLCHHLKLAEQLSRSGVFCTMYFHTRRNAYCVKTLLAIQALGHEVGYHHECLDRCRGDFSRARELFLREISLFRKDGLQLGTVCSHGEAGLPRHGYKANWELFVRFPELLQETGVSGEVYLWLKQHNPLYASDTFRNYQRFWEVLADASMDKPMIILVHPHRWHRYVAASSIEVARDLWQHLQNRIRGVRGYDLAY